MNSILAIIMSITFLSVAIHERIVYGVASAPLVFLAIFSCFAIPITLHKMIADSKRSHR